MLCAILVLRSRSFMAPVEMWPVKSSSAARPPMSEHISSSNCSLVVSWRSSGMYHAAPKARPRGTMLTLTSGFACWQNHDMVAWPASWRAMERFSSAVITFVFFSRPPMMRSTASRKSCLPTTLLSWRAAMRAASLQTLAMSAPENPGVWRASMSTSTFSSTLIGFRCTLKMSRRSGRSGRSTCIWRSKRPARRRALSSMSTRLVAARMMTPELVPKPSISVSRAFSVFSRSSLPPIPGLRLRARPMASISSINMMHGDFSFALANVSRTREAPTPTNISTKSEPDMEKNGTPASPATAFARRVLPVPGGPTSSAPLGILPPSSVYFCGFFRNSTISCTSCLAPTWPATSLNVTPSVLLFSYMRAFERPTLKMPPMPPPPPPKRFMTKSQRKTKNTIGATLMRRFISPLRVFTSYVSSPLNLPSARSVSRNCSTWSVLP